MTQAEIKDLKLRACKILRYTKYMSKIAAEVGCTTQTIINVLNSDKMTKKAAAIIPLLAKYVTIRKQELINKERTLQAKKEHAANMMARVNKGLNDLKQAL